MILAIIFLFVFIADITQSRKEDIMVLLNFTNFANPFNIKNNFKTEQNNKTSFNNRQYFALKINTPLTKDTVSFRAKIETEFKTKMEAENYYQGKACQVNLALQEEDELRALKLLGYEAEKDKETGKIKINGEFKPYFEYSTPKFKKCFLTYKKAGIDQETLIQNVVNLPVDLKEKTQSKLDLELSYDDSFVIDRNKLYDTPTTKKLSILLRGRANQANEALRKNNYSKALNILGYDHTVDEKGNITILGDYSAKLLTMKKYDKYLEDYGINENKLLKNVVRIEGFADFGTYYTPDHYIEIKNYKDNHKSDKVQQTIASLGGVSKNYNIPINAIQRFVFLGALKRTKNGIDIGIDRNREFLDTIKERRDEILTEEEILKKYGINRTALHNAIHSRTLTPYGGITERELKLWSSLDMMFDIADKNNEEAIKHFEELKRKNEVRAQQEEINANILKNSKKFNFSIKKYPAVALEQLGYGSKADLMAASVFNVRYYELCKYILERDSYDISIPEMMTIVQKAKASNPALVKLSKLKGLVGEDVIQSAIENRSLNIITDNPYHLTTPQDYMVDISDRKNQEFLKTVDDSDFQTWLDKKLSDTKKYREENQSFMEEFKKIKIPPTKLERMREIQKHIDISNERQKQLKKEKRIEDKLQKKMAYKNTSLRTIIAWFYAPNTRQVMKENSNAHISEIINRREEAKQIQDELLMKEINYEEAQKRIKALKLEKRDEIDFLSYCKSCWEISGSDEFKLAMQKAKLIVQEYNENGIDGIEDTNLRKRIEEWEQKYDRYSKALAVCK